MAEQTKAPPGTFCWNELMTRNLPAAKAFYTKLLGWTTEEMDMGPAGTYTIWKKGDTSCGGMMQIPQGPGHEKTPVHWMSYVTVDNVDAATKKAQTLGAKIQVPPTDIPNIGRFSIIADPTGASVGLYQGA